MPDVAIAALAIACACMGGVFFAFSTFVIRALGGLPASAGIRAMQSINVFAVTPVFMTMLFGTAAVSVGAAVVSTTLPVVAGAVTYVLGTIVVTIACNVPLNNALAAADADAADAVWIWSRYRRQWLAWNHVRTLSGVAAAACFTWALV